MSIASQLQALESNISDAYNMVAQRGGTMPQRKNMENLDDAIATIPSGGGSTPTTPTLTSATLSNGVITLTGTDFGSSPKVLMFNRKYDRYDAITPTTSSSTSATVPVGAADYGYFSRVVKVQNGGYESDVKFVYSDFESVGSIYGMIVWCYGTGNDKGHLVPYGGTAANFSGGGSQVGSFFNTQNAVNYTGTDLSDSSSVTINSRRIRGAEISPLETDWSSAASTPLLGQCGSFNQPFGFCNLTKVNQSGGVLVGAYTFDSPIDVSSLVWIPANFLRYSTAFNQPLTFRNITMMGNGFMVDCLNYNQPLTISGVSGNPFTTGANAMYNCVNMASPITFENCTVSGAQSFYNMTNMQCINLHSATTSGGNTFFSVIASGMLGSSSAAYLNGVTVNGDATSVDAWLAACPDLSGTYYRHFVRGTVTS